MSDPIRDQIDQAVKNNKVLVFMKGTPDQPMCGFSAATIQVIKRLNVPFAAVNVLEDEHIRQGVKDYSSWPTIPQIFINGEFVGGNDIIQQMYANGELQKLVQE
jgi:monothiol glutaredoxin